MCSAGKTFKHLEGIVAVTRFAQYSVIDDDDGIRRDDDVPRSPERHVGGLIRGNRNRICRGGFARMWRAFLDEARSHFESDSESAQQVMSPR
jgi:hypothetical protein